MKNEHENGCSLSPIKSEEENSDSPNFLSIDYNPFEGGELQLTSPSTESQREIWTSAMMGNDASLAFNESISLKFTGPLNIAHLECALQKLIERHESLRATFSPDGKLFCVAKQVELKLDVVELSKTSDLKSILRYEVETPFNLEHGPLFRARLVKISRNENLLIMTAHHIICDGWSFGILLKDLGRLYVSEMKGQPNTLVPANKYSDYAKYLIERTETQEYATDEAYWIAQFKTIPEALELPIDKPRPPLKTYAASREDYPLDAPLIGQIKKTGANLGCSFVQTLLAGFEVLLYRLSLQEDLVVGISAAGQSASGQTNLVGHCVNTLPLRHSIEGNKTFSQFLQSFKNTMLDAFEHQQYTYGTLLHNLKITRDPSRLPLCSILFNVDQTLDGNTMGFEGLDVKFTTVPRIYENFEIFINAVENVGSYILEVQYNSDLFTQETIHHYLTCYETLLRAIAEEPNTEIARIPVLSHKDLEKMLVTWNETEMPLPETSTLPSLFREQVLKTPNAIAVQFENNKGVTYSELDKRSNQLAHYLQSQGVGENVLVGIYVDRSVEMLVAALAVLKAHGAYVPLDSNYPKDRIEHMLNDSKLSIIITQSWLKDKLSKHQARVLLLDSEAITISALSATALKPILDTESPAYVIYTSGSTGKPKGVVIPHRALTNFLLSMREKPGMTQDDTLVAVTTLSFDIAALELYLPIITGARIVIASSETATDGVLLLDLLKKSHTTMMQATPTTWRLLMGGGWNDNTVLGAHFKILCGGEALARDLCRQLLQRTDILWNVYGPTETTVWSTCAQLEDPDKAITIGRPIANTELYILDDLLQPVPIGVSGALYIAGAGVSLGYLNREDLTNERFIENPYFNPFASIISPKMYKTGDLARFRMDGSVEYLGRSDKQVKLRGYRIELEEIEASLAEYPLIQQCVVILREEPLKEVALIAYAIPKPGCTLDFNEVKTHLRTTLPEYMIPQRLSVLTQFPLTQNGKIDRKALPAPDESEHVVNSDDFEAPESAIECLIADIWSELLHIKPIGLHDNFFNLGGHSLLSMQFIIRLQEETGYRLNPRLVLLNTLAQIADTVTPNANLTKRATDTNTEPTGIFHKIKQSLSAKKTPQKKTVSEHAQASFMQERIWKQSCEYPGLTAYNLPTSFKLTGTLNLSALQMSLNEFIHRHTILRTNLIENKEGVLEQVVMPNLVLELQALHLSSIDEAMNALHQEAIKPFDLSKDALIRAQLYKINDEEHILFIMPHHTVWDGWSFDIFLNELNTLYEAFSQGRPSPLHEPKYQYNDYALWQRKQAEGQELIKERSFWLNQLSSLPSPFILHKQKMTLSKKSHSGDMVLLAFSKNVVNELKNMGHKEGVTLSIVLLSAFKTLLYAYSGQKDLLVGLPVLGRTNTTFQNVIGAFVNLLPIRTKIDAKNMTFRQLINQVEETTLDAYQHQEMHFEQMYFQLKEDNQPNLEALTQAQFSYQDATQRNTRLSDISITQILLHPKAVATPLLLWFKFNEQGLNGAIEYSTELFDASFIMEMKEHFSDLLELITKNLDISIAELAERFQDKPEVKEIPQTNPNTFTKSLNPFFFESLGNQIFGIYCPPLSKTPQDTAVLICNPIGQEYIRCHFALRTLSSQLTRAGFPVLRFDYYATGDSEGETQDGNIDHWKEDIISAANKLKLISGVHKIALVGLRFGATLATLATESGLECTKLILWDPIHTGADYLNELKELHKKIQYGDRKLNFKENTMLNNSEELIGFVYPSSLKKDIAEINLLNSTHFNTEKTLILTTNPNENLKDSKIIHHHIQDAGDWDNILEAHNTLMSPKVIQTIVNALKGELL